MIMTYLRRGVTAGGVAGVAYALYVAFVAAPFIEHLEHAHRGHDHAHHAESAHVVSETTTLLVSVAGGTLWAIFLGGVFALGLYILEPALPGGETVNAAVLAGGGFLTVSAVPWLALPPAPPGAEYLYDVESRAAIYVGLVALGALTSVASVAAHARVAPRHRLLSLLAGAVPLFAVAVGVLTLTPSIVSHPGVSADLVSAYRGMVVLSQTLIWAIVAATFVGLRRRDASVETAGSAAHRLRSASR